jgi:hypothetical protein
MEAKPSRLQTLAVGSIPYRHFDFAYGLSVIYPILWAGEILHISTLRAYILVWLLEWSIGIGIRWVTPREPYSNKTKEIASFPQLYLEMYPK